MWISLIDTVANTLQDIRDGKLGYPIKYENRFHILRHTEIFSLTRNSIHFREGVNEADTNQLIRQINAIVHINNVFQGFDYCSSENELQDVIASGEWGRYFDGVKILNSHIVEALTQDKVIESTVPSEPLLTGTSLTIPQHIPEIYAFRDRTEKLPNLNPYDRRREIADPEITKIKLQRRNLVHKELIDKMESWLRNIGANPKENEHIDLFAKIPGDGSFIFEMKSGGDSLLEQIRKGLSQLYEYRYRYRSVIDDPHISLCLVLPENPITISWVTDYLCNDREINICWFDEQNTPLWPDICTARMAVLHKKS
ncbi:MULTISPECIES: hypothetical protein [unclassified Nostoc]|uniref:hypothetical protein n=1 Tax=unclassified Nostoc TaxID=2593658 RepID=UPI0026320A8B|nr:hypothetical protein [Nostoc sp. S13]MDF5739977.1 hypothetical protein [Nostoc sp. S13]